MMAAAWLTAPYTAQVRVDYSSALKFFFNNIGGLTIEYIIVCMVGTAIVLHSSVYLRTLFEKYENISQNEAILKEQVELLDSMAQIYDYVNLIDFEKGTERSMRDSERKVIDLNLSERKHTHMTEGLADKIAPDHMEAFLKFTEIATVPTRLVGKKFINAEFVNMYTGWFRAQYITVEEDNTQTPVKVIFTIQGIDSEKRRQEHLLRIALTDELTRLYNRRSYDEDIGAFSNSPLAEDFGIISIDVNGLKRANDNLGHVAGDELIKGAADCLVAAIGTKGKTYRTGGDEFISIVFSNDFPGVVSCIQEYASKWQGSLNKSLSLSVGYASHRDNPGKSITELEKIADDSMYHNKAMYYKNAGIDRRSH